MWLVWSNEVTAVPAFILLLLVAVGFIPYIGFRGRDPRTLMRRSWLCLGFYTEFRLFYWDILAPSMSALGRWGDVSMTVSGSLMNASFNLVAIAAALMALASLHGAIPDDERSNYTWLTAPIYPYRFPNFWRSKL